MISDLEPDIVEGKVKWTLRNITVNKANGGDGISAELFQILKYDAMKVLHSICQQVVNLSSAHGTGKRSVFILIPTKGNAKECSNYCTIAFISRASKVISKFSMLGFIITWPQNFQMFKLDLEKAEQPDIKLPTSIGSYKKQNNSRKKHLLLHHRLHERLWLCGSQQTVENS